MAEITSEMVKQTYIMARKIYNKEIDKNSGVKILHEKYKMNENSAAMYVNNFRCLINGIEYGRIMKVDDTQYFLTQILNDYGEEKFKRALFAVKLHIDYIKSINKPSNVEQLYKELIKKHKIDDIYFKDISIEYDESETKDIKDDSNADQIINFTYEKDLQKALVKQAEKLFPEYKIFGDNLDGVEYQIEGKRIDLLLENHEKKELMAIELKAGIADFKVFGQISMYLGLLKKEFPQMTIKGTIIAGKIDETLKYATITNDKIKIMEYNMELILNKIE